MLKIIGMRFFNTGLFEKEALANTIPDIS